MCWPLIASDRQLLETMVHLRFRSNYLIQEFDSSSSICLRLVIKSVSCLLTSSCCLNVLLYLNSLYLWPQELALCVTCWILLRISLDSFCGTNLLSRLSPLFCSSGLWEFKVDLALKILVVFSNDVQIVQFVGTHCNRQPFLNPSRGELSDFLEAQSKT